MRLIPALHRLQTDIDGHDLLDVLKKHYVVTDLEDVEKAFYTEIHTSVDTALKTFDLNVRDLVELTTACFGQDFWTHELVNKVRWYCRNNKITAHSTR